MHRYKIITWIFIFLVVCIGLQGCGSSKEQTYMAGARRQTESTEVEQTGCRHMETDTAGDSEAAGNSSLSEETEEEELAGWNADQRLIESEAVLYVHVCGAVAFPGVYQVAEGARFFEAIDAAGGFLEEADTTWLNLADSVTDGAQIYVYTLDETADLQKTVDEERNAGIQRTSGGQNSDDGTGQRDAVAEDGLIDLNTADRETLMSLPGIGEAKAEAIISYRMEHDGFESIEEIQNISGIKNAVFSKIKDKIKVSE